MKNWVSRKVRFVKATIETEGGVVRAEVELKRPDAQSYVGKAERPSAGVNVLLAGAQAAAEAVRHVADDEDAAVDVRDIAVVNLWGQDIVVVSVSARFRGRAFPVFGVCHLKDDPVAAAALAVLSATNRVLGVG
jgi:hypothetical protein